jgi:hypothetical protein
VTVREWFENIRDRVDHIKELEEALEILQAQTQPKAQTFEPMGHGNGDTGATILRVMQASEELDRYRMATNLEIDRALLVLYGRWGNGGLARAKSFAAAECICGYYLMGYSWRKVANELVKPNSKDAEQWCKRRAYRGLEYIERKGLTYLVYC